MIKKGTIEKFYTHSPICRIQWVGFRKELGSLNRKMRKTNPTAKKSATKKLAKPFLHLTKGKPLRVCPSRPFLPKPIISALHIHFLRRLLKHPPHEFVILAVSLSSDTLGVPGSI